MKWKSLVSLLFVFSIVFGCPHVSSAEEKYIEAMGEYTLGKGETLQQAENGALQEALRSAAEKAGVYVESYTKSNNFKVSSDEIKTYTAHTMKIVNKRFEKRVTAESDIHIIAYIKTVVDLDSVIKKINNDKANAGKEKGEIRLPVAPHQNIKDGYSAGTYEVGSDIKAGEYVLISSGNGYVQKSLSPNGNIISNGNFGDRYIITVDKGMYLKSVNAEMYPIQNAPKFQYSSGVNLSGVYKVGTDIPAGEYVLTGEDFYFEIAVNSIGGIQGIKGNQNLSNRAIITLHDGEYLKSFKSCLYKFKDAPPIEVNNGMLVPGLYKIGTDIPAGKYKLQASGNGYACIYNSRGFGNGNIVGNALIQNQGYVKVKDGQFLLLLRTWLYLNK